MIDMVNLNEENIKKAVEKFYEIRNIPYHIALKNGEDLWNCETKNRKLGQELEKFGYNTRERIGLFRWSETGLPKSIVELPHDDESSHLFLEVIPPKRKDWIQVDCTWNPALKNSILSVSEWDGKSSTPIAFECYEVILVKKNEEYLSSIDEEKDLRINYKIYDEFNKYCDSFLKKGV